MDKRKQILGLRQLPRAWICCGKTVSGGEAMLLTEGAARACEIEHICHFYASRMRTALRSMCYDALLKVGSRLLIA